MPNQEHSPSGIPRKGDDQDRPAAEDAGKGDDPGKIGLNSDAQPDLVAPSSAGKHNHGAAGDKPMGGGGLNFEDGDMAHPYGKVTRNGRTWNDKQPSDAGELGTPDVGMSDHNGPSDPDAKRSR